MSRLNPHGQDRPSFQLTLDYQCPSFLDNCAANNKYEIVLPDKRVIEFEVGGITAGYKATIIYLHGSPLDRGCSLLTEFEGAAAELEGVRLIAPKRPGYGRSSVMNKHSAFSKAAVSEGGDYYEVRANIAYLYDLLCLSTKLGLQEVGLLAHSGGSSYAITAAALFKEAKAMFISKSNPPKIIPEITAIGVRCGDYPLYIWHQMSDSDAVRGRLFNGPRDDYAHLTKPGSKLPHGGQGMDNINDSTKDWAGYNEEESSMFTAETGAAAWGFELSEAGRFTAADGNGIRYFYGYMDYMVPSPIGLRLAEEVGGPFIYKTATHAKTGFQGHSFDLPSKRLVYRDMLEAMCANSGAKRDVAGEEQALRVACAKLTPADNWDQPTTVCPGALEQVAVPEQAKDSAEESCRELDLQVVRGTRRSVVYGPDGAVCAWRLLW